MRRFAVRPIVEDDWDRLRGLRLEMLEDTPLAYLDTLAEARRVDDAGWRARAERQTGPGSITVLAESDGRLVGTMGGYLASGRDPMLVSVFVTPAWRGSGLSALLLAPVEEWAGTHGTALALEVHERNPVAIRAYERLGFVATGRTTAYPLEAGGLELEMVKAV